MKKIFIGLVLVGVVLIVIGFSTELLLSYQRVRKTSSSSDAHNFLPLYSRSTAFNVSMEESILRIGLLANSTMVVYVQLDEKVEYTWEGSDLKNNAILPKAGVWVVTVLNNSTISSSYCTYTITVREFHYVPTKPMLWLRTPLLISGGFLIVLPAPIHFRSQLKHLFVKNKKTIEIAIAAAIVILFIFSYQIAGVILHTSTPWIVTTGASMRPTIYAGDMVIIQGVNPEDLANGGDIILFQMITEAWGEENFRPMETPVLHRVVEAIKVGDHWYYMTQGDNVTIVDDWWVPDEGVAGKAIFIIPKIGYVLAWLGTLQAKIFIIALIIFVAFVWPSIKPKKKQSDSLGQKPQNQASDV